MRFRKVWLAMLSLLCAVSLLFPVLTVSVSAVTARAITASTNSTMPQGNSAYTYVYIDSTKGLAALDIMVHFDSTKVKINAVYNMVDCLLYDSVVGTDTIQFSYIFDGQGSASKTCLFFFDYQVLSDAKVGESAFLITVGEAYDSGLNDLTVSGFRCPFTITETVTNKSCSVYGTSAVSTAVEREFTLNYRFGTYQIASGSAVISYDPELFEVAEVTPGGMLTDKITDTNTALPGAVYVSFVGTAYNYSTDFVSVTFRTRKNVTQTSAITFKATELCDAELYPLACKDYTTTVSVTYDDSYVGDAPKMPVTATYDKGTRQVTAVVSLEENSHLGAGDFILRFDQTRLALVGYEKGIASDFFTVNDKEADSGFFKFSVISLTDIVTAQTVVTLTFDAIPTCEEQTVLLELGGSMLADSLTNTIALNLIDGYVTLPEQHTFPNGSNSPCLTKTCTVCGKTVEATQDHTWQAADCAAPKVCTVCGMASALPLGHLWAGNNCQRCGHIHVDANGDGLVLSDDAVYLLYHTLLSTEYPLSCIADIDGNGTVDGDDAIYLLYYCLLPEMYPLG